jgi:hypothetical protein
VPPAPALDGSAYLASCRHSGHLTILLVLPCYGRLGAGSSTPRVIARYDRSPPCLLAHWQHHTIRGAISGALKKKLGLTIEATRTREVGPNKTGAKGSSTVYRIVEPA